MRSGPRAAVGLLASLVVAGALTASPAAASHIEEADCPEFWSSDQVTDGLTGRGFTVADGRTKRSFQFDVVGVMDNALGPGRDMIVVELEGTLIDRYGGAWAGMSGSPLYARDRLLGALSFALSFGSARIVGITPADEMYRVMDYTSGNTGIRDLPRRVPISRAMQSRIAVAAGMQTDQVAGAFKQLPIPFSVSGASPQVMEKISAAVRRENLPLIPYAGASSSGVTAAQAEPLEAGDNIVAVLSYGDITSAGTGTVTFACDGRVMAFGHPFLWEGDSLMGANAGTTLAIVQDPFGSFEIASIDEAIGAVDQDRYAGIRASMGASPVRIPITSSVNALNTGRSREGQTDVLISEMVPSLVFSHLYSNIQMTMDQYSEGSAALSWRIEGETADGDEWSLVRDNVHASEFAISEDAAFEITDILYALYSNRFEDVDFTGVDIDATVDEAVEQYTIKNVLVSTDGRSYRKRQQIRAKKGSRVRLRVLLEPRAGDETETLLLSVRIPRNARTNGYIDIRGGAGGSEDGDVCLYDPSSCTTPSGKKVESFGELLEVLAARPKNNELVASLLLGRRSQVRASDKELLNQVVAGSASIFVRIPGAYGGDGGTGGSTGSDDVVSDPGDGGGGGSGGE